MLKMLRCRTDQLPWSVVLFRWMSRRMNTRVCPDEQEDPQVKQLENVGLGGALELLETRQISPSSEVFAWIIRRCGEEMAVSEGKRVHYQVVLRGYKNSRYLCNLLVEMYGKCGNIQGAKSVFHLTPSRNVFSWTIMVAAFTQNGHYTEAIELLRYMDLEGVSPNKITFIEILMAVASLQSLEQGRVLHKRLAACGLCDPSVANCLINMYAKCRSLEDAKNVFASLAPRNVISWTALVAAYAQSGSYKEALKVFLLMTLEGIEPSEVTFVTLFDICADSSEFTVGREIHKVALEMDSVTSVTCVGNSLINMYGKCGSPEDGKDVFDKLEKKDRITWNSMIAVYGQNGYGSKALEIYKQMQQTQIQPDSVTFTCALDACCCNSALAQGKAIHDLVIAAGREREVTIISALINMYGKCSRLDLARKVFDDMLAMNMVIWNTMIMVYAQNSHLVEALELFMEMNILGIRPDEITFIAVLFACSHAGLLKDSCKYYNSMISDYCLKPGSTQCGCLIDLLGRSGWLHEAEEFINSMPFHPDHTIWTILMGACITHADYERGSRAADRIMAMNPTDSGSYIALSNMYALLGRWDDMTKIRKLMEQKGVLKMAGKSTIEIGGVVHEFIAGDTRHPQKEKIYAEVMRLNKQMKEQGYVPDITGVLHNMVSEAKEYTLCFHSERLAIAYGFISTSPGATLRIMKNLRVCPDCHSFAKTVTKVAGRKILLRDANRFHELDKGACSCEDYW